MSSGLQLQQSSPKPTLLSTAHPLQGAEHRQLAQRSTAIGSAQHHSGSLQQTREGPEYFSSAPTKGKGNLALKSAAPWCSHLYQEMHSQLQKDEISWKRDEENMGSGLTVGLLTMLQHRPGTANAPKLPAVPCQCGGCTQKKIPRRKQCTQWASYALS